MVKLYKKSGKETHYWETWEKDKKTAIVHRGVVGTYGENKEINYTIFSNFRKQIQIEIDKVIAEGFNAIDLSDHVILAIEFRIAKKTKSIDVAEKLQKLEERMNALLGWTGLGHCGGVENGSQVICYVVDEKIAKKVIQENLENTVWGDYKRIYKVTPR